MDVYAFPRTVAVAPTVEAPTLVAPTAKAAKTATKDVVDTAIRARNLNTSATALTAARCFILCIQGQIMPNWLFIKG